MLSQNCTKNTNSGFTLTELLAVVLLLSILGVSILQVITQIQAASQTAETQRNQLEHNLKAYNLIRSQLLALGKSPLPALQTANSPANNSQRSPSSPLGFGTQRYFEVSQSSQGGLNNSPILRFVTRGSALASPNERRLYGDVEARYYVDSSLPDSPLVMELWDISPVRNPAIPIEPILRMSVIKNVERFSLRGRINNSWVSIWDNPYAPVPKILELTLIRSSELEGSREVFRAAIPLGSK